MFDEVIWEWLRSEKLTFVITSVRERSNVQTIVSHREEAAKVFSFVEDDRDITGPVNVAMKEIDADIAESYLSRTPSISLDQPSIVNVKWSYSNLSGIEVKSISEIMLENSGGDTILMVSDNADYPTSLLLFGRGRRSAPR